MLALGRPRHVRVSMFVFVLLAAASAPTVADGPAPSPTAAHFEVRFMTMMIDHHAMAVAMAEICLDKAIHPELESMCSDIIAAQSGEIDTMQTWLQEWYGISHEPEMTAGDQQQMDQLSLLEGEAFEIEFMKMLIRHHWKAVVRGSQCIERAYHPELVEMCESMVMAQLNEIQTLQGWLCSWYNVCNFGPGAGRTGETRTRPEAHDREDRR
jgi:uncharacterized protein (DUF305 family)